MAAQADSGAVLLSRLQAEPLLEARRRSLPEIEVSLDLNRSTARVRLSAAGVEFPEGGRAEWAAIRKLARSPNGCFLLRSGGFWKIHVFSRLTQRPYSLMPTPGAPTALNAGFTMHRIQGITPEEDTRRKLEALGRLRGRILDTSTGLGYTAIEAARRGAEVFTVELDPAMLELAAYNPWSRELFDDPRIERRIGDAMKVLAESAPASFAGVIHDPPTSSLAAELYSSECHRRILRVLGPGGRLFHYVGNLQTRLGVRAARQVVRGLRQAGFREITPHPEAFGITATV